MMRLSTMVNVDSTIREDGSSPVAEQILERWVYDQGSIQFFRSSANFIYRFQNKGQTCFLRFADANERSREAVDTEIEIVNAVASEGVSVAAPIASRFGNAIETVDTAWGSFHAVVFPALPGNLFEIYELDDSGFRQWGAALGRLHATLSAVSDLPERHTWQDLLASAQRYIPDDSPGLRAELEYLAASFEALTATRDTYGLIHGDFELDNLVWDGTDIGILDFDDCSRHWYVADVALAVRELFQASADTSDPRFRTFVDGYREHYPLSEESIATLPLFMRYARLLTYARMARSMDLTARAEHPGWLQQLIDRLRERMKEYRASVESCAY